MTARNTLFLMLAGFFALSLLLIHNAYYKPDSRQFHLPPQSQSAGAM